MRRLTLLFVFVLLACSGGDKNNPVAPPLVTSEDHGTLAGVVTIGPNCPGAQQLNGPCPTPPSAYTARKVLVYDSTHTTLLHTVDIDTLGAYLIVLPVGQYVVDLRKTGLDSSASVPANVTIQNTLTTKVDIAIDTGIR